MTSIRRLLFAALIGVMTLVMAVAAGFSYRAGLQEAGEMFDAKLAQSSRVLMSLVDESLGELAVHGPGDPLVVKVWHGSAEGVGEALAFPGGHAYETKLAFQARDGDGRLLLRSESGPAQPLAPLKAGYADVDIGGETWRTFTLRSPDGRWYQSAELSDIRQELAQDVAFGTLLPLLMAVPLLALCIWLVVSWASRVLLGVSTEIEGRAADRLSPLRLERAPAEIQGLVNAVNGLLQRLEAALARERRFTGDAAHELRTPIAALKVHADNLAHARSQDERDASQRQLDASVLRIERLLAQLIALSRVEAGAATPPRHPVDLQAALQRQVAGHAALGAARDIRVSVQTAPAVVVGDEAALDALLRNLLDNALRYTPGGGEVRASVARSGDEVRVCVEDSGPGIPAEARDRVFARFHRELGSGVEGSGLGLAIVRQVLESHGGRILLDTSPDLHGLRATVALPGA